MAELDEDLVKELREQLDEEKKAREELVEELRASRQPEPEPEEPTGKERIRRGYDQADERRKAKGKEKGGDGG